TIQNDGVDGWSLVPATNMGNKDITWETSFSWNGGADFELFRHRLNGSIEYFHRLTKDLLYNKPLPPSRGFRFQPINILDMVNNGFEIDLNGVLVKTNDIEWSIFGNITWIRNRITNVPEAANKNQEIIGSTSIFKKGSSIYSAYMREYAGVDPVTGKALFYVNDPDKPDLITTDRPEEAKQVDLGTTYAPWYGGFGSTLNAYGFDLSIQFAYQLGGRLYDDIYQELMHSGQSSMSGYNWHKDILNSWTPENKNTDVPRLSFTDDTRQLISSRFLTSSNYLNLNNVVLGYSFPENWLNRVNIASLRLFVSGDNLALFSVRQGFDPRANIALGGPASDNSSGNMYSLLRTFSGGISIKF
ncbi:MAG: SusC/RagA family TonB-linked outer membrane protein, partial [Clostridiales bacterium]|nr:SusC/RagA family TonB-linked outer membrane protein [Clostridiales bacterium]